MILKQHIPAIEQFYQRLKDEKSNNLVQQHLLEILEHIHLSSESFDLSTCMQTPFYQEFSTIIQGQCTSADTCFALLECLIIFCREKQLRSSLSNNLPIPEQNLLNFYEKSELWNLDDATLLHIWYWHKLPTACQNN